MGTTITPTEGKEFEVLEAGTYPARLYSIVHQGTTVGRFWPQTQAILKFEIPSEKSVFSEEKGEQPYSVNVYVTVSYSQDAQFMTVLRKLWVDTTQPFDLETVLWKTCQVTVTHKEVDGKTYLNTTHKDIAPLAKWQTVEPAINKTQFFWINADYTRWPKLKADGTPSLNKEGKPEQEKKSCSNVEMIWYADLQEKMQDKIRGTWEYLYLVENKNETPNQLAWNKPTETEADSSDDLPFN